MSRENNAPTLAIISFAAGAALGAGLALLYAPVSGQEMRKKIVSSTDEAIDKIKAAKDSALKTLVIMAEKISTSTGNANDSGVPADRTA